MKSSSDKNSVFKSSAAANVKPAKSRDWNVVDTGRSVANRSVSAGSSTEVQTGMYGVHVVQMNKDKDKKKEHTKNARKSTQQKHQKGQTAKQNASINSQFQNAPKKIKNMGKGQALEYLKKKEKEKSKVTN